MAGPGTGARSRRTGDRIGGQAGAVGRPVPLGLTVQVGDVGWVSSQGSAECIAVSLITAAFSSGAVALALMAGLSRPLPAASPSLGGRGRGRVTPFARPGRPG